jgi:hypothetical protein
MNARSESEETPRSDDLSGGRPEIADAPKTCLKTFQLGSCGCRLDVVDGQPLFVACKLHEIAPALLEIVRSYLSTHAPRPGIAGHERRGRCVCNNCVRGRAALAILEPPR